MAQKSPVIPIRNLSYIRTNPHTVPLKGHLVAEAFDDVSRYVAQLQDRITQLEKATKKSS